MFSAYWKKKDAFGPFEANGWMPYSIVSVLLSFAFILIPAFLWGLLIKPALGLGDMDSTPSDAPSFLGFLFIFFGLVGVLTFCWVIFVERRSLASIGLVSRRAAQRYLRGWLVGVGMMGGLVACITLLGGYHVQAWAPALSDPKTLGIIALILVGLALQSSVEEILLRGWFLSAFAAKRGLFWAIVASAIIFTLNHFSPGSGWLQNVNLILFSLFLTLWALREQSIVGICAWHGGWNWLLNVGFTLPLSGLDYHPSALLVDLDMDGPTWLTGGEFGPEASVLATLFLGAACVVVWFWKRSEAPWFTKKEA